MLNEKLSFSMELSQECLGQGHVRHQPWTSCASKDRILF